MSSLGRDVNAEHIDYRNVLDIYKKTRFLCLLYFLFLTLGVNSQLSGLSMAYGKDFQSPLQGIQQILVPLVFYIPIHKLVQYKFEKALL